jgi:hypothetical protein
MNKKLLAPFTAEEVKNALFRIRDLKSLGPDGLHAIFYRKNWNLCGVEFTQEVLQALNIGVIPKV